MKKEFWIIVFFTFLLIISILLIIVNDKNNPSQKQYSPPICGNDVCESDEGANYCLDCNLSCKSELCNSKINVICKGCTEIQRGLLPTLFEHQNLIYDCLSNYYGYHPPRLIYHTLTGNQPAQENVCSNKEGCYIQNIGMADEEGVIQGLLPGLRRFNESDVTQPENVGFELHELPHVFTYYGMGIVPIWFNEGIAVYSESRILCSPQQRLSDRLDSFSMLYQKLKNDEILLDVAAPYDHYYKTPHDSHILGSLFFVGLEEDYNCNKECVAKILYSLYEYRQNCTGICFETAKKSIPELTNLSMNINDLRIQIITNEIIKEKSEEVTGKNLTPLFNLLKIG